MAEPQSLFRNLLRKGIAGLVVGAVLVGVTWALGFPPVFRWMFFAYAMLGAAVFMLLDARPLKPMAGTRAVVALVALYLLLSVVFTGGATLWPQYDPQIEKGKIAKILQPRKKRLAVQREQVDQLLKQAEALDSKMHSLSIRMARVVPASGPDLATSSPQKPTAMTLVDQGREVYDLYECYNCHKVGGKGGKKRGPVLDNIGNLLTISDLKKKIFDPGYLYAEGFEKEHKKGRMPDKYKDLMFDEELDALAAYLSTLKNHDVPTPKPVFVKTNVEHGFTVYGYVRDLNGKPRAGVEVKATPKKKHRHPGKATSNKEGYFEIFLHLHNEDAGTRISVSSGGAQKEIVANYDPNNKVTRRQASVDLAVRS